MPGRAEPVRGEDAQHRLPGHRGARVPLHRLQVTPSLSVFRVSFSSPSVVCRVRHVNININNTEYWKTVTLGRALPHLAMVLECNHFKNHLLFVLYLTMCHKRKRLTLCFDQSLCHLKD